MVDPSEIAPIAGAARGSGVLPQTLRSAIKRGEIAVILLADGTPVVRIRDCREWSKCERKRGPKPRSA